MQPINELVVLSHLRWDSVWQRPQQLISRLAEEQSTYFVEEPVPTTKVSNTILRTEDRGSLTRVWLEVPQDATWIGFDDPSANSLPEILSEYLGQNKQRAVWLYTPAALPIAQTLQPTILIYDVMDDLASLKTANSDLWFARLSALEQADVVFTSGRSLHAATIQQRPHDTFCFPDDTEVITLEGDEADFARARRRVINDTNDSRAKSLDRLLNWDHWDAIASGMQTHIEATLMRIHGHQSSQQNATGSP